LLWDTLRSSIDYLQTVFGEPVLLSGPLLPEPPKTTLEEKWAAWLKGFKAWLTLMSHIIAQQIYICKLTD
jgi:hypothetical protein